MVGRVSMATRAELVAAIADRYRASNRTERTKVLDEFVAITGYHRKHAIRLLRRKTGDSVTMRWRVHRRYGDDVKEALVVLWEASDRLCSKRLKPTIPILLPALVRHGQLPKDDALHALLLSISPATIDRLLSEVRLIARGGRRRRAGFSSAVRRTVPVRTFGDWNDPPPGFVEVDFVSHAGTSAAGSFVQTMVLTDIATGWTECLPLIARSSALVIEALTGAIALFPFPVRGVDFDNDGLFMNEPVVTWCRDNGLEITRSRAYRKNDQAWVEQKNGAVVRRLVGYGRLEGVASAQALVRLYAAARLHTNLFQPSFKLRQKTRIGARIVKRYHAPALPVTRVLAHPAVDNESKEALRRLQAQSDPVMLIGEIRAAQADLGKRIDRRGIDGAREPAPAADLERFASGLRIAWRDGERRPSHRRPYRRHKPLRRRPSMLDDLHEQIQLWLADEPGITATEILARITSMHPDRFTDKQARTVQRAVKRWRHQEACRIIIASAATIGTGIPITSAGRPRRQCRSLEPTRRSPPRAWLRSEHRDGLLLAFKQ